MHYTIQRNFWSVFERSFRVFSSDGQEIMYVKRPLMKLREQFTVYSDSSQTTPLLNIKAQQIIAINDVYEIVDAATGERVGSVQKRGFKSLVRDRFLIFDAAGRECGYLEEEGHALLRRFIPLLTSEHAVVMNDVRVASVKQRFRFFIKEFDVEVHESRADNRFVLACALLALMAEARREDRR